MGLVRSSSPRGRGLGGSGPGANGGGVTQLGAQEQQPPAQRAHEGAVARLQQAYAAIPPGDKIRLAKRTSNLFRFRDASPVSGLDVSAFSQVICVDPDTRTARVGGMTTYEDLADATLRH